MVGIFKNARLLRRCCWAIAVLILPIETPKMPAGMPSHELSPQGREPWSMAFFNTPGIERLYSGVAKIIPSQALICDLKFATTVGTLWSASWL